VGSNDVAGATRPIDAPVAPAGSRRLDALEINDSIVQGLTVIKYALELGDLELARNRTEQTLAAARRVITDLLTQHLEFEGSGPLEPGSMVRSHPASPGSHQEVGG